MAIINTQAASHSGVLTKANARGYGYSMITLGDPKPEIEFYRFGTRRPVPCAVQAAKTTTTAPAAAVRPLAIGRAG